MTLKLEPVLTPAEKQRRENWKLFAFFLIFSAVEIYEMQKAPWPPDNWRDLAFTAGAILFPVGAIVTLLAALRGWPAEKTDRLAVKLLGWIFGAPALIIVLALIGWGIIAGLGAPAWALVIIALLALIAWRLWRPARRY